MKAWQARAAPTELGSSENTAEHRRQTEISHGKFRVVNRVDSLDSQLPGGRLSFYLYEERVMSTNGSNGKLAKRRGQEGAITQIEYVFATQ